jgi:hypothetical protein
MQVDDDGTGRPTFALAQPESEYTFLQLPTTTPKAATATATAEPSSSFSSTLSSDETLYTWTLDFTSSSGRHRGVVMSQSRMREIESVLDPSHAPSAMDDSLAMMEFGNGNGLGVRVGLICWYVTTLILLACFIRVLNGRRLSI